MDVIEIKKQNPLLEWITRDLGYKGKTHGRYTMFNCPFHDDANPSLAVYGDSNSWYCFGCESSGDIFTWRELREGIGFKDAIKDMGRQPGPSQNKGSKSVNTSEFSTVCRNSTEKPSSEWQDGAINLTLECSINLFSDKGVKARNWLMKRGLTNETIETWQLGYLPAGEVVRGYSDNRNCISIPWLDGKRIWKVNFRRGVPKNEHPKYRHLKGSKSALFGTKMMKGCQFCIVTEGELDAILLWQELGEIADVISLGGATNRLPDMWLPALLHVSRFLILTDNDSAGHQAANYWAQLTGERSARLILPVPGKDVTEAFQGGFDLRSWIQELF